MIGCVFILCSPLKKVVRASMTPGYDDENNDDDDARALAARISSRATYCENV